MPPVTAAVTTALISAGVSSAVAGFIASALVSTLTSFALSFVTGALAGKPENPNSSSFGAIRTRGATQQFRQPVTERKIIYGEYRTSGAILYAGVTDDNRYLHLVIEMATHEIEEIGEMIVNDLSVPSDDLDGNGVVQSGRYANLIRVSKNLGLSTQVADALLVSSVPEWTSNHRLRGIAYAYVRLEWNRDVFTSGIPNFSFWVKGKKCMDERDTTERWTPNIALQVYDYLTNTYYGLKATSVDLTELNGAANTCDEFVTTTDVDANFSSVDTSGDIITLDGDRLPYQLGDRVQLTSGTVGGLSTSTNYYVIPFQRKDTPRVKLASSLANAISGTAISLTSGSTGTLTKNAEPRYFGGGIVKMNTVRGENLKDIVSGMSGQVVYAGGKWRILAGEYQTPTISLDEGDLAGPIETATKVSEKDRFNRVQGVYVSPINDGNPSDYPLVKNDTYAAEDGKIIKKNLDFPFTPRPHTAQRMAKLQMERMRQELIFSARFKLTAFKLQVGDNFYFTFERYGWTNKIFEVTSWSLSNDRGVPFIEMVCRENASAVYDWNNGEETAVDPAPNTSLPSPFDVDPPTGLAVTPIEIRTASGDLTYEFKVTFTPPDDFYVTSGGYYETQYKESNSNDWENFVRVEDDQTSTRIKQVSPAVNYDFRMRSVNYLGSRSQWQQILGFNVSSPSGATISLDYGLIDGTVTETRDYGLVSVSHEGEQDYGDVI